jgi:DNA-binding Xre family transcriptional regulator
MLKGCPHLEYFHFAIDLVYIPRIMLDDFFLCQLRQHCCPQLTHVELSVVYSGTQDAIQFASLNKITDVGLIAMAPLKQLKICHAINCTPNGIVSYLIQVSKRTFFSSSKSLHTLWLQIGLRDENTGMHTGSTFMDDSQTSRPFEFCMTMVQQLMLSTQNGIFNANFCCAIRLSMVLYGLTTNNEEMYMTPLKWQQVDILMKELQRILPLIRLKFQVDTQNKLQAFLLYKKTPKAYSFLHLPMKIQEQEMSMDSFSNWSSRLVIS